MIANSTAMRSLGMERDIAVMSPLRSPQTCPSLHAMCDLSSARPISFLALGGRFCHRQRTPQQCESHHDQSAGARPRLEDRDAASDSPEAQALFRTVVDRKSVV